MEDGPPVGKLRWCLRSGEEYNKRREGVCHTDPPPEVMEPWLVSWGTEREVACLCEDGRPPHPACARECRRCFAQAADIEVDQVATAATAAGGALHAR